MTRINAGIPPRMLANKHLLAEHREIKRIPNMVYKHGCDISSIPTEFTLGKGHVKFFYNKMHYTYKRYKQLYSECRRRGFKVTNYEDAWYRIPIGLGYWQEWEPTAEAIALVAERINDKLNMPDDFRPGLNDWHDLIDGK